MTTEEWAMADQIFRGKTVTEGPFAGVRFSSFDSIGLSKYPKVLGSYESELHPQMEDFLHTQFDTLLNIGCETGYYACGFALNGQVERTLAFDVSREMRKKCEANALFNGVAMEIGTSVTRGQLLEDTHNLGEKALVICDIEGGEADLFDEEVFRAMSNHTFVIECHNFIDPAIMARIEAAALKTHSSVIVYPQGDIIKAYQPNVWQALEDATVSMRWNFLREGRPDGISWLIIRPAL